MNIIRILVVGAILVAGAQGIVLGQGVGSTLTTVSLAQATGARLLGMGGTFIAVSDEANVRNPATLIYLGEDGAEGVQYLVAGSGATEISNGPEMEVRGYTAGKTAPQKYGVALRWVGVNTDAIPDPATPGSWIPGEATKKLLLLSAGIRVGSHTSAGLTIGTSSLRGSATMGGVPVALIKGEGTSGSELGLLQELGPGLKAGLYFSSWDDRERVTTLVPAPQEQTTSYRTTIWRGGVSYSLGQRVIAALEYGKLVLKDLTNEQTWRDERLYYGVEAQIDQNLTLRAGSYGQSPSFGLGWKNQNWRLDYAAVDDLNKKSVEEMLGISGPESTTHYLFVTAQL